MLAHQRHLSRSLPALIIGILRAPPHKNNSVLPGEFYNLSLHFGEGQGFHKYRFNQRFQFFLVIVRTLYTFVGKEVWELWAARLDLDIQNTANMS